MATADPGVAPPPSWMVTVTRRLGFDEPLGYTVKRTVRSAYVVGPEEGSETMAGQFGRQVVPGVTERAM